MTPFVKNALTLLNTGRISEAISYIRKRLIADRNSRGLDQLQQLEQTYRYLLKYLAEGQQDPDRDRMFSNIRESLYAIVNGIGLQSEQEESSALYHSVSRSLKYSNVNFEDALGRFISADTAMQLSGIESDVGKKYAIDRDRALKDIFAITWTLPIGEKDILKSMSNVAAENGISHELRALIVGALYLALDSAYDRYKFIALLDIYLKSDDKVIQARALTAIILILHRYSSRIQNDLEISLRFETINETEDFASNVQTVFFELVKARGGLNLLKRIEKDILPDIMREGPKMMDRLKKKSEDSDSGNSAEDIEWEEILSKRVEKKLHKLNDLQANGGDIMLANFARNIAKFYYFNDVDAWFRTFETSEAVRLGIPPAMAELWKELPSYNTSCDLDKYVLALTFSRLPDSAKQMMSQQLGQQVEQMKENFRDMEIASQVDKFQTEAQNFARVIFRFFNYFRSRAEFKNPFDHAIDIFSLPFIGGLPGREETYETLSDFYFHQGFYNDAIKCLEEVKKNDVLNYPEYEKKIGYCHEKLNDVSEALKHYKAALDSGGEDEWLLKKIYSDSLIAGDIPSAHNALSKLCEIDSENINNIINLIDLRLRYPDETSGKGVDSLLSKAYYLFPDDVKIIRFKAANEGLKGNFEKGLEYLAPRMADISMYLAEQSLKNATLNPDADSADNSDESGSAKEMSQRFLETREMSEALIEDATLHFALNDLKSGIDSLSKVFDLKECNRRRIEVEDALIAKWKRLPAMAVHLPRIPMYLEAAIQYS